MMTTNAWTVIHLSTVVSVGNTMVCVLFAPLPLDNMRCHPLTIEKINAEHPLPEITLNGQPLRVRSPVFNHEAYFEHYRNESAKAMHKAVDPAKQDSIYEKKKLMREAYNQYLSGEITEKLFKDCLQGLMKHIEALTYGN